MMPDNATQTQAKDIDPYRARTAANMAEALSFLIRIALQARMQSVAISLAGVRKELQVISAQSDASESKQRRGRGHQDDDRPGRAN